MKLAIRDDDTCYFTKPRDIENIYAGIWDTVPVSLAVVPFIHSNSDAVPPDRRGGEGSDRELPIGENRALVDFIKDKIKEGKLHIMLHGYSHRNYRTGFEYDTGRDLYEKTKKGKEYLEELFDVKIRSFVPPHHALSRCGMKAVVDNNLNIAGTASLHRRFLFDYRYLTNLAKVFAFRLKYGKRPVRYPYVLDFGDHKEVYCYVVVPKVTLKELIDALYFTYERGGVFCITGHVSSMSEDRTRIQVMKDIVKESRKLADVEYVSVNELFD